MVSDSWYIFNIPILLSNIYSLSTFKHIFIMKIQIFANILVEICIDNSIFFEITIDKINWSHKIKKSSKISPKITSKTPYVT